MTLDEELLPGQFQTVFGPDLRIRVMVQTKEVYASVVLQTILINSALNSANETRLMPGDLPGTIRGPRRRICVKVVLITLVL